MKNELYIVSSVFHLLISVAVSAVRNQSKPYFVFIRFNEARYQQLVGCLSGFVESSEQLYYLDSDSNAAKKRKLNAIKLLDFAKRHEIQQVFVGNDRHVEFQYLAYHLKTAVPSLKCVYLDEGLYSYLGRGASKSFAERVINQGLKKLFYGLWWQTPATIGASSYVDEAWLAYPDQACETLSSKSIKQLPLKGFDSGIFQSFIECWGALYDLPPTLQSADFVITITDEKNFKKFTNYRQSVTDLVSMLVDQGKTIAVKYHPNANNCDLLNLQSLSERVMILPSGIPFEVLLPLLSKATLIAEFSSTLITSRLLVPSMEVWAVVHESAVMQVELDRLCRALEIQQLTIPELTQKVLEA